MNSISKIETQSFKKLLIANRGEIAVRVIRTANQLGYQTVAVYSDADAAALHVLKADEAVHIGPSDVSASYLMADKILEAAQKTGADAIHPGYGFLSENADFARRCEEAGLVFIGPEAAAIDLMGNKAAAKRLMIDAGVPCVPGYQGEDQSDTTLIAEAASIGFPIMVKAAAGGGGKGMRLVEEVSNLPAALIAARSEAMNAFGSDELILERAIISPRHVEIQVFADIHGNVVHLGERDCSMQRRHQKVVEESPSPAVGADLRERMGEAAVNAAKTINYRGAGTVEFLLGADGQYYFLEMNTRLQVEHPVTEMVTGFDLVAWQLNVAAGQPLPVNQQQIKLKGHAIEVRLYAENPYKQFLPATGTVELWQYPDEDWVRVDHCLQKNGSLNHGKTNRSSISPYYDPMVAKIICWGEDREQARRRLIKALMQTALLGVPTNKHFLLDALQHSKFATGDVTTAFIAEAYGDEGPQAAPFSQEAIALAGTLLCDDGLALLNQSKTSSGVAPLNYWSSNPARNSIYEFEIDEVRHQLNLLATGNRTFEASLGERTMELEILSLENGQVRYCCDGVNKRAFAEIDALGEIHLDCDDRVYHLMNLLDVPSMVGEGVSDGTITAVMHGLILRLMVEEGQTVKKGAPLLVLEAMKMEHEIYAPYDGVIAQLSVSEGAQVQSGQNLLEVRAEPGSDDT